MKKLFYVLIPFVLLLFISNVALASTIYEKPILFRGIDWGSNYNYAIKAFPPQIEMSSLNDSEYWYRIEDYLYKKSGNSRDGVIGARSNAYSWDISGLKVAGYEVDEIELLFTYLPGESGLLSKAASDTALIYAEYKLKPKDADAAYTDLTNKLTALYGDIDATNSDSFFIEYNQNEWFGADGTKVSLVSESHSSDTYIYIKYAFDGANELMDNAYNALILEETQNAASNTDGL